MNTVTIQVSPEAAEYAAAVLASARAKALKVAETADRKSVERARRKWVQYADEVLHAIATATAPK